MNMLLFLHGTRESILYEEPRGLLGSAGLLRGSSLHDMVNSLQGKPDFDGKTQKAAQIAGYMKDEERYGVAKGSNAILKLGAVP
jgi:hypothetical protein